MNLPELSGGEIGPIEPVMYDSHIHTPFCGHALGRPAAYVWQACRRNLKGLIFTCHNPMPDGFTPTVRMAERALPYYLELIDELCQTFAGVSDVKLGLECDWLPGYEGYLEDQLASADFDYVLGSLHAHFPDYHQHYVSDNIVENQIRYFDMLAQSAETRLFDCLAHPDQIKNVFPDRWNPEHIREAIARALDRIAEADVAMEMNTSGIYKAIPEMNPGFVILSEIQKRGIPIVIGSDAHQPERVGDEFELALDILRDLGFTHVHHYAGRERIAVDIAVARKSLAIA